MYLHQLWTIYKRVKQKQYTSINTTVSDDHALLWNRPQNRTRSNCSRKSELIFWFWNDIHFAGNTLKISALIVDSHFYRFSCIYDFVDLSVEVKVCIVDKLIVCKQWNMRLYFWFCGFVMIAENRPLYLHSNGWRFLCIEVHRDCSSWQQCWADWRLNAIWSESLYCY